ncbi:metallophosphoesterase family protein [Candidatus Viridilinea mediisalina]|uniref:Metallophosphoesterase n=1 Tax=Candidatus Viridilinea mediisalina TaxID=2024553 RepID=A0A2A6RM14_9CHLR|nr:metallophosphoesterase [Candidatus Viridilinea mediisalina]PDW04144.1 metallophosphoesterase [Candidatus Viridilinea mediisalina]
MQILTISDELVPAVYSLNLKQRLPHVDCVLSCGDLPYYYIEFVLTTLQVPCFFVYGNHDGTQFLESGEQRVAPRGAVNVEGRIVRHGGLSIAGLGGSLRYKPDGAYMYTDAEMMRRTWRLVPSMLFHHYRYGRYLDILITHAPPFGIHNGPNYPHHGFKAFLWLMDRFRPRYLIHGHVHLSYGYDIGIESCYGETTILNTVGYRVIEVEPDSDCRL